MAYLLQNASHPGILLGRSLASPGLGYGASPHEVIDDQYQLVVVIAVKNLDVDACLGHPARELAQLAGLRLTQALHEHFTLRDNADSCRLKRSAGRSAIVEEKVSDALAVDDKGATTLNAHSSAAERIAHFSESARPVIESDRKVFQCDLRSMGAGHLARSVGRRAYGNHFESNQIFPGGNPLIEQQLVVRAHQLKAA
jgi:hypothetical protein